MLASITANESSTEERLENTSVTPERRSDTYFPSDVIS